MDPITTLHHHADRVLVNFVTNYLDNAHALLSIASTLPRCKRRTAAITKAGKILRLINALEPQLTLLHHEAPLSQRQAA